MAEIIIHKSKRRPYVSPLLCLSIFLSVMYLPHSAHTANTNTHNRPLFSLCMENDAFGGTDRYYTSGFEFTWHMFIPQNNNSPAGDSLWDFPIIRGLPIGTSPHQHRSLSFSLGQKIFTPDNLRQDNIIVDDRPYAGIAYFALRLHSRDEGSIGTLGFDLGVVGPHSYAEKLQEAAHNILHFNQPEGWAHQLKDEPVLGIVYDRRCIAPHSGPTDGWGYNVISHIGGGLGNAFTYGHTGAEVRFGWNLKGEGTSYARSGCRSGPVFNEKYSHFSNQKDFEIYAFSAIDGRAVLRDITLDGNTFRDSHSVEKKHVVIDVTTGITLILDNGITISYAHVFRSREFEKQRNWHDFGAICLSFYY